MLIDEIDKADVDFPNDLLAILDDPWSFTIAETGEVVTAQHKPIVIITSNKEKGNLPAPFLRRCLYYYVEFPDDVERLKQIVGKHFEVREAKAPDSKLLDRASHRFIELRKDGGLHKKPGTSEFLDWLEILYQALKPAEALAQLRRREAALSRTPVQAPRRLATVCRNEVMCRDGKVRSTADSVATVSRAAPPKPPAWHPRTARRRARSRGRNRRDAGRPRQVARPVVVPFAGRSSVNSS